MKPKMRKAMLSTAIPTTAFSLVILTATFGDFANSRTLVIFGNVVMAMTVAIAALVWSRPPPADDDPPEDS